jgi:hypothetical protein
MISDWKAQSGKKTIEEYNRSIEDNIRRAGQGLLIQAVKTCICIV